MTAPPTALERPFLVSMLAALKVPIAVCCFLVGIAAIIGDRKVNSASLLFFGLGAVAATTAIGLWRLRPYGWWLQIPFSVIGLVLFPVGTACSAVVLVYFFRRGTRILFSGRSASSLGPEEAKALVHVGQMPEGQSTFWGLGLVLGPVVYAGIVFMMAIPNLLGAIDRGKQKRTMADLRAIGAATERYRVDHNAYPVAQTIDTLLRQLSSKYGDDLEESDGWGERYQVTSTVDQFVIFSRGQDQVGSNCQPGVTFAFSDEICFANGEFIRYPQGTLP